MKRVSKADQAASLADACLAHLRECDLRIGQVQGLFYSQDDALAALYQSTLTDPLLLATYLDDGQLYLAFYSRGHAVCSPLGTDAIDRAFNAAAILGFQLINSGEHTDGVRTLELEYSPDTPA